jgi:hypothetical protein
MVALREYPAPTTQLDSSIFEVSEEDEYRSVAESFRRSTIATTPVATNSSGFSSSSLLQLVHQRDYASANHVRTEMIQYHLPITPDPAFVWPAIHTVKSSMDPVTRLKEFSEWLSLLPVANEGKSPQPKFGRLLHVLSTNTQVDVDLAMAFVRICVSKGYLVKIPDLMIPLVVRFAAPSVSRRFLEDLYSLVAKNFALDKQLRRKIRFWCKAAMTEYLGLGLVEEATRAFEMGVQYDPSLPRLPYRQLEKAITRDPECSELSEETTAALKPPKIRLPRYPALSPLDLDIHPSDPKALVLRVWENAHSMEPPEPLGVARFLEVFDSRPTIIQLLSARNQLKPPQYRGQWALGEMLYYVRRKEWRELIGAFDAYFFSVGVPKNISEHKSRGRVTPLNVQQRLFPSPYHTSLVWMAVAEILRGVRPVSLLFNELVKQITVAKTRKHAQAGPLPPYTPPEMFDASHFTPFFVASYREGRYKRLVAAFSRMHRLGIEPTVKQLSLLAGAYARLSEGQNAVRILDRVEGIWKEEGTRSHCDSSRDMALYMPALAGFMVKKDTSGALSVKRRVIDHGYVGGTSPYIDRMLARVGVPTAAAN